MARTEDASDEPEEDAMLPDEAEVVAERLGSLEEEERLSLSEVAEALESEE